VATKSNKKQGNSNKSKFVFKGFHNVTLDERERNEFLESDASKNDDVLDAIVVLAEVGYKCSFSFDGWRDSYVFSATAKRTNTSMDGYCFTFYHRDATRAIAMGAWYLRRLSDNEALFVPVDKEDLDW